jgi:hypothetical protein
VEYSTKLLLGNEQLKKAQQATGVLQKWGICTKFEHWNSNQHLY